MKLFTSLKRIIYKFLKRICKKSRKTGKKKITCDKIVLEKKFRKVKGGK